MFTKIDAHYSTAERLLSIAVLLEGNTRKHSDNMSGVDGARVRGEGGERLSPIRKKKKVSGLFGSTKK